MMEEEQLRLLATDGMLVKRPLIDELLPMAPECRVKSFENGILVGDKVGNAFKDGLKLK